MRVKFLGVGEAFDERLPNTSIWVRDEEEGGGRRSVLLDCGFTAPPRFWASCADPDELQAIWISHFHGDHFFGIPALLTRFWESGRRKPLVVAGQEGVGTVVSQAIRLAYSSVMDKFGFELQFLDIEPGNTVEAAGFTWSAAESGHPQRNLALRLARGGKSLFYGGDGPPTDQTLKIAHGCDLVIHEAFSVEQKYPSHGSMRGAIDFASNAGAKALAFVHIQRDERRERRDEINWLIEKIKDMRVFMPEPDEEFEL